MTRNQKGFSAVAALLVIVVIAAVGGVGWYVWHKHQTQNTTTQTKQPTVSRQLMADWKEYCSKSSEKACFKYPPDWTTESVDPMDPAGDAIQLNSPNGMHIAWQSVVSGIGGGCDAATEPHVYIHKVLPLKMVSNLYLVETGDKTIAKNLGLVSGPDGKAPITGDTGECLYYTAFGTKGTIDSTAWLQGDMTGVSASDLANAEQILLSFHYQ